MPISKRLKMCSSPGMCSLVFKRLPVLICLSLVAIVSITLHDPAHGQVSPTECDRLAASDLDHERMSAPVPLKDIDPNLAVPACVEAVAHSSETLRFVYQLGRSQLAAAKWFQGISNIRKAAEGGYAGAQVSLSLMYQNGWFGVATDSTQALNWTRQAADGKNPRAQAMLAQSLEKFPATQVLAFALYCRAAANGDPEGQAGLGVAYLDTGPLKYGKDVGRAVEWLQKAAKQGSKKAEQYLNALRQDRILDQGPWKKGPDKCIEFEACLAANPNCT